jgi:peptide chain release factor 3
MAELAQEVKRETARRRTFAIISHPDAGKTTLTEKFLLYSGAVAEAGAVRGKAGRRTTTSDWMTMEQERGISVASTVLQFNYRDHVINLLDTPGHRDFSEDTYRVLTAVDAAIMVLDVAKGIESQTLKLFEVCKAQGVPIITFLNKYDRPGRDPLELLDEIEEQIGLRPTPATWPVGIPGDFRGVINRSDGKFIEYERTAGGGTMAGEKTLEPEDAAQAHSEWWQSAIDNCSLFDELGSNVDTESFLAGESTPVFVGSALTNFGVRHLLDAIVDLAPAPSPHADTTGQPRPIDSGFSGFIFKIQANMDKFHRDHVAFVRVCSGRFDRGMVLTHEPTGKPFSTKYATSAFGSDRNTIDIAYPGDVVGLVNASGVRIADSLYDGKPVSFPSMPAFTPELFAGAWTADTTKAKKFQKGLEQLEREGVVQVLKDPTNPARPVLAAVGQMQFEVFSARLDAEFGAKAELDRLPYTSACLTDEPTAAKLAAYRSIKVLTRGDGALLAAFESPYMLERLRNDNPEWVLT